MITKKVKVIKEEVDFIKSNLECINHPNVKPIIDTLDKVNGLVEEAHGLWEVFRKSIGAS